MLQRGDGPGKAGAKLGLLAPTASQELVTLQGDLLGPWLPGVLVCPPASGAGAAPHPPFHSSPGSIAAESPTSRFPH